MHIYIYIHILYIYMAYTKKSWTVDMGSATSVLDMLHCNLFCCFKVINKKFQNHCSQRKAENMRAHEKYISRKQALSGWSW